MRRAYANFFLTMTTFVVASVLVMLFSGHTSKGQSPAASETQIRRGVPVRDEGREDEDARAGRRAVFFGRLAGKAEADRRGRPERLTHYLEVFKRELIKDARLFAFDVRGRVSSGDAGGAVVLEGFAEFSEQRDALISFLRALGFDKIEDRTAAAPAAVDAAAKSFGLVTKPRTFLFDRTSTPRETVSECTIGEGLYLLQDEREGHLLCHASDGYVGYVPADHVMRVDARRFEAYRAGGRAVLLKSVEHGGDRIPVGATLKAAADGVVLPDGTTVAVGAQDLRRVMPDPRIERIVETALTMAGTKYQWGGKTAEGIDCSGLVQLAFRAHGVHLPRDSDQQALVGALVATRWHRGGLRRGDTLFFLGRQGTVTHTALYLGDGKYVEAAGPDVRVSSFDPKDEGYAEGNAKSFCFGRRVLE